MTVQFSSGNVFVADTGNSRIQEFDNAGKFIREINMGIRVATSDNIVWTLIRTIKYILQIGTVIVSLYYLPLRPRHSLPLYTDI
jgi:hypothetical protein